MSLIADVDDMLALEKEDLAEMLLVAWSSIAGMLLLQMIGKLSMSLLSNSDMDAKFVVLSFVRRRTEAS